MWRPRNCRVDIDLGQVIEGGFWRPGEQRRRGDAAGRAKWSTLLSGLLGDIQGISLKVIARFFRVLRTLQPSNTTTFSHRVPCRSSPVPTRNYPQFTALLIELSSDECLPNAGLVHLLASFESVGGCLGVDVSGKCCAFRN